MTHGMFMHLDALQQMSALITIFKRLIVVKDIELICFVNVNNVLYPGLCVVFCIHEISESLTHR